ncbi:MAG: hypothetical protein ACQEQF_00235 [Bacillota bacterium]
MIKILLEEALGLAYKINEHDVFVDYSPHVNKIDFEIYLEGWEEEKGFDEKYEFYLNDEDTEENLEEVIDRLKELRGL